MINLDSLPKDDSEKLFRPWWELLKDYVLKATIGVIFIIGALQLTSDKFVCLPVRESNGTCLASKDELSDYSSIDMTCRNIIDVSISIRLFVQSECFRQLHIFLQYFQNIVIVCPVLLLLINMAFYNWPAILCKFQELEKTILRCNDHETRLLTSKFEIHKSKYYGSSSGFKFIKEDKEAIADVVKYLSFVESVENLRKRFEISSDTSSDSLFLNGRYLQVSRGKDNVKMTRNKTFWRAYWFLTAIQCVISSGYLGFLFYILHTFDYESKCVLKDVLIHAGHYDYFLCRHSLKDIYYVLCILLITLDFVYIFLMLFQMVGIRFFFSKTLPDYINHMRPEVKDEKKNKKDGDIDPLSGEFKLFLCLVCTSKNLDLGNFLVFLRKSFRRELDLFETDLKNPYKVEHASKKMEFTNIKAIPSFLRSRSLRDSEFSNLKCLEIKNSNLCNCGHWDEMACVQLSHIALIECGIKELPDLSFLQCLKSLDISRNDFKNIDVSKLPKTVMKVNIKNNSNTLNIEGECFPSLFYFYVDKGSLFKWTKASQVYVSDKVIETRLKLPTNLDAIDTEASEGMIYEDNEDIPPVCIVIINHQIQKYSEYWDNVREQVSLDQTNTNNASEESRENKSKNFPCFPCMNSRGTKTVNYSKILNASGGESGAVGKLKVETEGRLGSIRSHGASVDEQWEAKDASEVSTGNKRKKNREKDAENAVIELEDIRIDKNVTDGNDTSEETEGLLARHSTSEATDTSGKLVAHSADGELKDVLFLKGIFESFNCNVRLYGRESNEDDANLSKYSEAIKGRAVLLIYMGEDRNVIETQLEKLCENEYLMNRPKIALQLQEVLDNPDELPDARDNFWTLFAPVQRKKFLGSIHDYFNRDDETDLVTMLKDINGWQDIPGSKLHGIPSIFKEKKFYFLQDYPWKNFLWERKEIVPEMPRYDRNRFTSMEENEALYKVKSSVGELRIKRKDQPGYSCHTCFRVGDRYIMTQYSHFDRVIAGIDDENDLGKTLCNTEDYTVEFLDGISFRFEKDILFMDKSIDVIIIGLQDGSFPTRMELDDGELGDILDGFIIGFQGEGDGRARSLFIDSQCKVYGKNDCSQSVLLSEINKAMNYVSLPKRKEEFTRWPPYNCRERCVVKGTESDLKGYGGSPVIRIHNGKLTVIALLQERFPTGWKPDDNRHGQLQFQVALPMETVSTKIRNTDRRQEIYHAIGIGGSQE